MVSLMINEHLLKKDLKLTEVSEIYENLDSRFMSKYLKQLPVYTIGCCPYCGVENTEHLDTYTLENWKYEHTFYEEIRYYNRGAEINL